MDNADPVRLWRLNYHLTVTTIASVSEQVSALGLELKELIILDAVGEHPHPAALSERLMIPKPSMTAYLKRLEGAGLVKREIDSDDLRRHRLTITTSGKRLAAKGMALFSEAFGAKLDRLSPSQRATLAELLEVING